MAFKDCSMFRWLVLILFCIDNPLWAQDQTSSRIERWKVIEQEFESASKSEDNEAERMPFEEFDRLPMSVKIKLYEASGYWPVFKTINEFILEAPADEASFQACLWHIQQCGRFGVERDPVHQTDLTVWKTLADYHREGEKTAKHCFDAAQDISESREYFLRTITNDETLPASVRANATFHLAELLTKINSLVQNRDDSLYIGLENEYLNWIMEAKADHRFWEYCRQRSSGNLRKEAIEIYQSIIQDSPDVELVADFFRGDKHLGNRAKHRLYTLEYINLNQPAPDIIGKDLYGNELKLSDYRGKTILLNFWFTGCGPCVRMKKKLLELIPRYESEGLCVIGVTIDESAEEAIKTMKESNLICPTFHDGPEGPIYQNWPVSGYPTTFIIDSSGNFRGTCYWRDIDKKLEKLFENRPQ